MHGMVEKPISVRKSFRCISTFHEVGLQNEFPYVHCSGSNFGCVKDGILRKKLYFSPKCER